MTQFKFDYPPGATPLNTNEASGLKLSYISTQRELNAAEQDNILKGENWAFAMKRSDFLSEKFFRYLHTKMFGLVWSWAGSYRTTDKSIGVPWFKIPEEINKLIADTRYWISQETYPLDEIAARLHHRLVAIHPFPNGNGRWARVLVDVLLYNMGAERFSWGSKLEKTSLDHHGNAREKYIHALKKADARNYDELLQFVRS